MTTLEKRSLKMSSGQRGEADVAYELDFHYEKSTNWVVIHDLRLEHAGRVAQIDHLVINRFLEVWVCESKRFAEGIAINSEGECTMFWNSKPIGIGSPHEQNKKHIQVIQSILKDGLVSLPTRLGVQLSPSFHNLTVISKNARISRPKGAGWWEDGLAKVDQLRTKIDKTGSDSVFLLAKTVSFDVLEQFARDLVAQHKPKTFDWAAKFGLKGTKVLEIDKPGVDSKANTEVKPDGRCHACNAPVEDKVISFCRRFNKVRFGGQVYCKTCQEAFPAKNHA
jgi:hypothetical protein